MPTARAIWVHDHSGLRATLVDGCAGVSIKHAVSCGGAVNCRICGGITLWMVLWATINFSLVCVAQTATTSLRGAVVGPSGLPIPLATVMVTDPAHGFTKQLQTNELGQYNLQQIPPG